MGHEREMAVHVEASYSAAVPLYIPMVVESLEGWERRQLVPLGP